MEYLIIEKKNGEKINLFGSKSPINITKAEQRKKRLGENVVALSLESVKPINFSIKDKITVFAEDYFLNLLPTVKKTGERLFSYDVVFESIQYELAKVVFLDEDLSKKSTDSRFDLRANLKEVVGIIINNLNRDTPGLFRLGTCPDTEIKDFQYSDNNCLAILQQACESYETEFDIKKEGSNYILNIGTIGRTLPLTFKYGLGGGAYEISRQTVDSSNIVTRLFAYGSDKNIPSDYRNFASRLRLGVNPKSYIEDAEAIKAFGIIEGVKSFDDIYPRREGTVTKIGDDIFSFTDSTMDFDLNEKDANGTKYLIDGTSAKITFNTGGLAGYTFELIKDKGYNNATKTFKIIQYKDQRGFVYPNPETTTYQIKVGDKYVITDINPPQSYITAAEKRLLDKAKEYLKGNSSPRVKYEIKILESFLKKYAGSQTANVFELGDYVGVVDKDINVDRSGSNAIRINGFKRDIIGHTPYAYTLEVSDALEVDVIERVISEQSKVDTIIKVNNLTDASKAKRNYKTTQELLNMVFDQDGYFSEGNIRPNSIETQMLSVGAKSQQMILRDTIIEANYQGKGNVVRVTGGVLVHYGLFDTPKSWNITSQTTTITTGDSAAYIYVRCPKSSGNAVILFDLNQKKVEDANHYYFLLGVLHSLDAGVRWISLTYGSSSINGAFIKTGRIVSSDGQNYIDLDNNQMRLGDNRSAIEWNKNGDKTLRLKGSVVVSPSGEESPAEVDRGEYSSSKSYYIGDKVWYQGIAYSCISNVINSKVPLLANDKWKPYSKDYTESIKDVQNNIDNLQVGGRNLALNTSSNWSNEVVLNNTVNQCIFSHRVLADSWIKGKRITVSFDYKYINIVSPNPSAARIIFQGSGNVTGWDNGAFSGNQFQGHIKPVSSAKSGILHVKYSFIISEHHIKNSFFNINIRHDYLTGKVAIKNLMIEMADVASVWSPAPEDTDEKIKKANEAAIKAQQQADTAKNNADKANKILSEIADDNLLVPSEKSDVLKEIEIIKSEYPIIKSQATGYSIATTSYDNAYNALNTYVTPLLSNMNVNTSIKGNEFRSKFKSYYDAKTSLLKSISDKAKQLADTAQKSANNANSNAIQAISDAKKANESAAKAQRQADTAKSNADKANKILSEIADDNLLVPSEKSDVLKEIEIIKSEYPIIKSQATGYSIATTSYDNAYKALTTYVTPLLSNMNANTSIKGNEFRSKFKSYYDAKTSLLKSISDKAKQLADNAQKKAEQTQSNLDNLQVGGRNLALNTNSNHRGWFHVAQFGSNKFDIVDALGVKAIRHICVSPSSGWHVVCIPFKNTLIRPNTKYTFSADIKSTFATTMGISLRNANGTDVMAYFPSVNLRANTWEKVKLTTTSNRVGATSQIIYITGLNATGNVIFANLKLEEGSVASAWSPAPEDTDEKIKKANEKAQQALAESQALSYLKKALAGSTTINGGLLLTSMIQLGIIDKDKFLEKAGINGTAKNANDVVAWFGGTLQEAIRNLASIVFRLDGSGQLAKGNIKWDAQGNPEMQGKVTSVDSRGNKIILDANSRSVRMETSTGLIMGRMSYEEDVNNPYQILLGSNLTLNKYMKINGKTQLYHQLIMDGLGITCRRLNEKGGVVEIHRWPKR